MALDKVRLELEKDEEEAFDKGKQVKEEDEEVLDREQQELGERVQEVGGIMMRVGVKNHADGDQGGCDDQALDGGGQDHGKEGLGVDDGVHHEEAWEDDENYECHAVACEDDECHVEACEGEDDRHDEGLEELVDGDHEVDGDRGVEDDDHDAEDDDLDGHKDQGVHMVQDDDDGEGWP